MLSTFLVISSSALHAFYELVDGNLTKIFDTLKILNEEYGEEKDSADILRLALNQFNLKHLSDLDVVMVEDSYAKGRLEHLLSVMCGKVQEYQSNLRTANEPETNENDNSSDGSSGEELDDDEDEDGEEEEEEEEVDEGSLRQSTEIDENEEEEDEDVEDNEED